MNSHSIAVIGAGLAGLACARSLTEAGLYPQVFEAQRAPGGRLATRRFEAASFDHGAQYLTVANDSFDRVIRTAHAAGAVARWSPRRPADDHARDEFWVGAPGMNSLPRWLAQDLDVEYGARIVRIERGQRGRRGWTLVDDRGGAYVDFAIVVLALPAPAAAGLAAAHTSLAGRAQAVPMAPCWAAMVAFVEPLEGVPDAAWSGDPVLPWFARNGSKPGRDTPQSWVLHASADWSRAAFDQPAARVQQALFERFSERIGRPLPRPLLSDSHRWRQARVETPLGEPFLLDADAGIGFCGDWCIDARAEAAFLSGDALGAALARSRRAARSGKMRESR
jgi:renalase